MELATLASGSSGNACLIRAGGAGLLIDAGIGPRAMEARLRDVGCGWDQIAAVVLTHTHGDHVHLPTLRHLLVRRRVPLYCHDGHRATLRQRAGFAALEATGLVRPFDERPWLGPAGFRIEPVAATHDDEPTYGFRVEARPTPRGRLCAVGYLADTGCWRDAQADALADVGLVALESNHDPMLQRASGRPAYLIRRILGDRGHLSNGQAAGLLSAVLARSRPGSVRTVVLLHLSEQCNRPELAVEAADGALRAAGRRAAVLVARQWVALPCVPVGCQQRRTRAVAAPRQPLRGTPWPISS
jgi:phosphoribosyl 1,2-cyclic phosphodiesterase